MLPSEGEQWEIRSERRRVVRVVQNPIRARGYQVFVHISYPGMAGLWGEWLTGHQWAEWKATRRARLVEGEHENPRAN